MRKSILAFASAAALAGCGAEGERTGGSAAKAQAASAVATAEAPETEGEWRRVERDGILSLQFGESRDRPLAALRCDAALEILLIERMTVKPQSGVDTMKVTAGGESDRLPVVWDGASLPIASATVRLEDGLMDRIAGLADPIEIDLRGEAKLVLPPDRRIGTLIEECRQS